MNKMKFEIVDKRETINNFVQGNISEQFCDNYYYAEIINGGAGVTNNFRNVNMGDILDAVNDPDIIFLHKIETA